MEKFGTQVLSKISMENSSLLNIQTKTINIKLKIVGLKKVDGDITTALSIKYNSRPTLKTIIKISSYEENGGGKPQRG